MTNFEWYDANDAAILGGLSLAGFFIGYAIRGLLGKWQANVIEKEAHSKLLQADQDIKRMHKEASLEIRAEGLKAKEVLDEKYLVQREEQLKVSVALDERAAFLNRKDEVLTERLESIREKEGDIGSQLKVLGEQRVILDDKYQHVDTLLQSASKLSPSEARKILYQRAETEIRNDVATLAIRLQQEAQDVAKNRGHELIATAIQRYAASNISELTTTIITLLEDGIKGRVIGREGRNIRLIETLTGVDVLIDDIPNAIVLSCFDPVRREIARVALEALIADGRIHPTSIEAAVKHAQDTVQDAMVYVAEQACIDAGVEGLGASLLPYMGRLKYRTSYSQNILQHSIEVASFMGMIAPELGLKPEIARRVGFLHDIGKSIDQTQEGTHAALGATLLRQAGESDCVVNAVAAHHGEVEGESLYAVICQAADALSSARPGARSETGQAYIKRLENLEKIALSFSGVRSTYAIQAGREIRVIVNPELLSDSEALLLARRIASKIQSDMLYPGQIRVTVSRETHYIEYAR